jgi:hypothetical protein
VVRTLSILGLLGVCDTSGVAAQHYGTIRRWSRIATLDTGEYLSEQVELGLGLGLEARG